MALAGNAGVSPLHISSSLCADRGNSNAYLTDGNVDAAGS